MVIKMTENITTALTVYTPKGHIPPSKFKIFLQKTNYFLYRYFFRNKRLFCILLFSFTLLLSFFTAIGKFHPQNALVFSIYLSNKLHLKFILITLIACFVSLVPFLGKAFICLYSTFNIFVLSNFLTMCAFNVRTATVCVISAAVIFFLIIITVALFEISSLACSGIGKREYTKIYYFRLFTVLTISLIICFLLTLLFELN